MAPPILTILALTLLFYSTAVAGAHRHRHLRPPSQKSTLSQIQLACNATRYPSTCQSDLAQSASSTAPQIIISALSVSSNNLNQSQSMVNAILAASSGNHNRSEAAKICLQLLDLSSKRTAQATETVSRARNLKDARAWASAAMVYQYDCWSALKYVNGTSLVNATMAFMNDSLLASSSNALSMLAALISFGSDVASWAPPKTERDGFWDSAADSSESGSELVFPAGLEADVTVCASGCDFTAVQKAVDAAPSGLGGAKRHVIRIKEGVYDEIVRVAYEKTNLVFVGDGVGKTVITGALNVGFMGITTYNTATVGVFGDGFMASGLTIQNTAGAGSGQAVAFRSDSDLSFIEDCEFLGNQDTLYAHSLRQLYKSCRIEGNVDFIFGMSASLFQNCTILVRPRQAAPEKGETNAIAAHGRTDPAMATGFAFFGCVVNGTDDYMKLYNSKPSVHKNYLGRPWKEYSRTVFIDSDLGALISPPGWLPWSGDFALKTLYYGEYGNTGAGADLSQRVSWSSQIPAEHVGAYSAKNFIQANEYSISAAESAAEKKPIGM